MIITILLYIRLLSYCIQTCNDIYLPYAHKHGLQKKHFDTINYYIHITFLKSMASWATNWVIYLSLFGTKNKFHGIIDDTEYI